MIQTIMLPEVFKRHHEAHFVTYDLAPWLQGDVVAGVETMPDNPASQMVVTPNIINHCLLKVLFQGGLLAVETHDLVVRTISGQVFGFTVKVTNRDFNDIAWFGDDTCNIDPDGIIDGGTFP